MIRRYKKPCIRCKISPFPAFPSYVQAANKNEYEALLSALWVAAPNHFTITPPTQKGGTICSWYHIYLYITYVYMYSNCIIILIILTIHTLFLWCLWMFMATISRWFWDLKTERQKASIKVLTAHSARLASTCVASNPTLALPQT